MHHISSNHHNIHNMAHSKMLVEASSSVFMKVVPLRGSRVLVCATATAVSIGTLALVDVSVDAVDGLRVKKRSGADLDEPHADKQADNHKTNFDQIFSEVNAMTPEEREKYRGQLNGASDNDKQASESVEGPVAIPAAWADDDEKRPAAPKTRDGRVLPVDMILQMLTHREKVFLQSASSVFYKDLVPVRFVPRLLIHR